MLEVEDASGHALALIRGEVRRRVCDVQRLEQPYVLGMPPLLAWIVGWVLLTSAFMGLILALDRRRDVNES